MSLTQAYPSHYRQGLGSKYPHFEPSKPWPLSSAPPVRACGHHHLPEAFVRKMPPFTEKGGQIRWEFWTSGPQGSTLPETVLTALSKLLIFAFTVFNEKGRPSSIDCRCKRQGQHLGGTSQLSRWSAKCSGHQGQPRVSTCTSRRSEVESQTAIATASKSEGHHATGWNLFEDHGALDLGRS